MRILSERDLQELDKWFYRIRGVGMAEKYMRGWWDFAFRFVPESMSPTLLTLLGFLVGIIDTILIAFYTDGLTSEAPRWVYVVCASGFFFYQTMDSLDGKQCRKTGRHSAVEDFADHGSDALSSTLQFIIITGCAKLGFHSTALYILLVSGTIAFYSVHWGTYVTGVINVSKFDHTEAQHTGIVVLIITSIFGTQFWDIRVAGFEAAVLTMVGCTFMAWLLLFLNLGEIFSHQVCLRPAGTMAIGQGCLAFAFFTLQRDLEEGHLIMIYAIFVALFAAKQDQKIMIAHYVKKPVYPIWDNSLLPVAGFAIYAQLCHVNSLTSYLPYVLTICCAVSSLQLAYYYLAVSNDMAQHYGIEILCLKPSDPTFYHTFLDKKISKNLQSADLGYYQSD